MKTSSSSQTQTLKTTAGIISLLIAAMTFNSCEKMDITPDAIEQGEAQGIINYNSPVDEGMLAKTNREFQEVINHDSPVNESMTAQGNAMSGRSQPTKPSLKPMSSTEPYKVLGKAKESVHFQQQISSKVYPDSENKPNGYGQHITSDTTTSTKVYPRD